MSDERLIQIGERVIDTRTLRLSFRDQAAIAAMEKCSSIYFTDASDADQMNRFSKLCYDLADAMEAERLKRNSKYE
jgi:hypothetical protein